MLSSIQLAPTQALDDLPRAVSTLPDTVFTVVEHGVEIDTVIGVFEYCRNAVEVAFSHATCFLKRCCIQTAAIYSAADPDPTTYVLSFQTTGDDIRINVRHQANGEIDALVWWVRSHKSVRTAS